MKSQIIAISLISATLVIQPGCGKEAGDSTSKSPDASQNESALAIALNNWRAAGGAVDLSELNSPSLDTSMQNAATIHIYLMEDVYNKIPDTDIEVFGDPWEADRKEIHSLAKYYGTTIQEIKEAANIEKCDWGVDYSEGFETALPYLGYLRLAAKMVRADAIYRFDTGDTDGAVESLECGFRLSRQAADGKVAIGGLVGISIEVAMYDTINELCRDNPEQSLAGVRSAIESQDLRLAIASSLRNEATTFLGEIRKRRLGSMVAPLDDSIDPAFSAEIIAYLDLTRTFANSITSGDFSFENAVVPEIPDSWASSLGISNDGTLLWVSQAAVLTEAYRSMAIRAIELREEKLKTGKYPDPSTYPKTIDPYDGGTITYQLNPANGGFTLTSSAAKGTPPEPIVWEWQ